jgi:hypothetical protein
MLKFFLKSLILKNRNLIFQEAQQMQGFLVLLFKQRNTDLKWTQEEKKQIKKHLKRLSAYVPVILIFILPGGSLLLPFLAEILGSGKNVELPIWNPRPPRTLDVDLSTKIIWSFLQDHLSGTFYEILKFNFFFLGVGSLS